MKLIRCTIVFGCATIACGVYTAMYFLNAWFTARTGESLFNLFMMLATFWLWALLVGTVEGRVDKLRGKDE